LYSVKIFVWNGVSESPTALSEVSTSNVNVVAS
jgi:hypothetical protein